MIDTREKLLIEKIRSLCGQLEEELQVRIDEPCRISAKEEKLQMLIEMSCDFYWVYDPTTNMVEFFYIRGRDVKDMPLCRSYTSLQQGMSVEVQKEMKQAFLNLLQGQSTEEVLKLEQEKRDHIYHYEIVCRTIMDVSTLKIIGVTKYFNKTEVKKDIVQEEEKFNALMGLANMYIWEYDIKTEMFYANASLFKKLGLENRKHTFEETQKLLGAKRLTSFKEKIEQNTLSGHAVVQINQKDHPLEYIFETNFKSIRNKFGKCQMVVGTLEDITEKEILKTNASKDPLTNCFNRRTADITLHSTFEKFKKGEEFYTLIFFDIDFFKRINDSYGHDMGDYVLKRVCEQITKEIRSSDMLCRWGGDEFLLICTGIAKENIYAYIDRLRKLIELTEFSFNRESVHITLSMGAAYYYHSDTTYDMAMKRADRSVYKAKLAGRNKVCILK